MKRKPLFEVLTKLKFKHSLWILFIINLIIAIILLNTLPFNKTGETVGFIISVISLYFIPYGVFVIFTHLLLKLIRRQESKLLDKVLTPVKLLLNSIPFLAFYGVIHILFFVLPQAISEGEYMRLNGISMGLGLLIGGTRSILKIREYNTHNSK